jgi:hypothetical protein
VVRVSCPSPATGFGGRWAGKGTNRVRISSLLSLRLLRAGCTSVSLTVRVEELERAAASISATPQESNAVSAAELHGMCAVPECAHAIAACR